MVRVGVLRIDFHISESSSLKDKRSVLRRLKDRVRNGFNVSISEVDNHDKWQLASFAIACVSNDKRYLDGSLNKIRDLFEKDRHIVVSDYRIEII